MSEPVFRLLWILAALQGDPVSYDGLAWIDERPPEGKPVVVRWWTNGCPLCSGSSDALQALAKKAAVVAVYHPKPPRDVEPGQVREWAKKAGIPGVLAVDRDWAVLKRWTAGQKRDYTSLTFLLDGRGRVRYVHPGGVLSEKDADDLGRRIEALRAE